MEIGLPLLISQKNKTQLTPGAYLKDNVTAAIFTLASLARSCTLKFAQEYINVNN
jgi:hypothetical protein